MLMLRTLGEVDLSYVDGGRVLSVLSQPKRLALFVYLAVEGEADGVGRDQLMDVFWPDSERTDALNSLRQAVSFIRRSIGKDALRQCEENRIRLSTEIKTDLQLLSTSSPEDFVEGYGGHFLENLYVRGCPRFARWSDGHRSRLREAALGAAMSLASDPQLAGDVRAALKWSRRASEIDPLNKDAIKGLITALTQTGEPGEAAQVFKAYAARMATELGEEVGPDLTQFVDELRLNEPNSDKPRALVPGETASDELLAAGSETSSDIAKAVPRGRGWMLGTALGGVAALLLYFAGPTLPVAISAPYVSELNRPVLFVSEFTSPSDEPEVTDFAAALAGTVRIELSRIGVIDVRAPSVVDAPPSAIEPLSPDEFLLEASVHRVGNNGRVVVQLIGRDRAQGWSSGFDFDWDSPNPMWVHDQLARVIAVSIHHPINQALAWRELMTVPNSAVEEVMHRLIRAPPGNEFRPLANAEFAALSEDLIALDSTLAFGYAVLAHQLTFQAWAIGGDSQVADSAVTLAGRAIALDPTMTKGYAISGFARNVAGDLGQARLDVVQAIRQRPTDALQYHQLGYIEMRAGRTMEGARWLIRGFDFGPRAFLFSDVAILLSGVGEFEHSGRYLKRAESLRPNWPVVHIGKVLWNVAQGRTDRAKFIADSALALSPESDMLLEMAALASLKAGALKDARGHLSTLDSISPYRVDATGISNKARLANVLQMLGDSATAEALLYTAKGRVETWIAKTSDFPRLYFELGGIHAMLGNEAEALDNLELAIAQGRDCGLSCDLEGFYSRLEGDPRFERLRDQMKSESERLRFRVLAQFERGGWDAIETSWAVATREVGGGRR